MSRFSQEKTRASLRLPFSLSEYRRRLFLLICKKNLSNIKHTVRFVSGFVGKPTAKLNTFFRKYNTYM